MKQMVRLVTPDNSQQAALWFVVMLGLITAQNLFFQLLYFGEFAWSLGLIVLNSVFVGGPFAAFSMFVGHMQVKTLRELSLRSRKDGLTGLNNRQTFMRLAQLRLTQQPNGMLLLLDADHFKRINDTYGHAVGDTCLMAISRHLQWNLRGDDVAGRIGGEEFAVYLAGVTIEQARVIGARFTQPIPFSGSEDQSHLCVTLSAGGVLAAPGVSLDRLLVQADNALYAAKDGGRAQLVVFDAAQHCVPGRAA